MRIPDTTLGSYATCSLATFEHTDDESVEACARELLRWEVLEVFNGRLVPLPVLRKKFVSLWNDRWPDDVSLTKGQPVTAWNQPYWNGIRTGNTLAATLWRLFDKYEVLRPIQPYDLPIGGHVLAGEYAIIGRRKLDPRVQDGPYVLVPHSHRPVTFTRPDLAALARWKHAMMSGEYLNLGIYHLPLLRGQYWRDRHVAEPLVQPWLSAILNAMAQGLQFPAPSGWCDGCIGKACMKVFHETT